MQGWREAGRDRRRAVFALAVLAHAALVATMWRTRLERERPSEGRVVEATIWQPRAPALRVAPAPAPSRVTRPRARAPAGVDHSDPRAIRSPVPESPAITQAASAAAPSASAAGPPASAASQPLDLTLSREQLRAIIAGSKPTLAQILAAPPGPSALARLGGDDAPYEEVQQPGGVTQVHVHGGCFRLVPTPRAQYDPFNHANERVTAACR